MKFDMSEAWREASAMMRANREVLLVVAGIFFLLPNLLLMLNMPDFAGLAMEDPRAVEAAMMEFYATQWWVLIVVAVAGIVGNLALLALLRDTARPTVREALRLGLVGLLPAFGVYLLFVVGAVVVLGLLFGLAAASGIAALGALASIVTIAGLVYLSIKLSMSGPVIAVERLYNPVRIIQRSWRLTKGNSVRLLLFFVLILIVYLVISVLAGVFANVLAMALGDEAFKVLDAIVTGLLSTVLAVVLVAVLGAVHRQLAGPTAERLSRTFE
ncbi:MAG: hypothetical protein B7Z33_07650 [Sphingomonadales bacterium 12-68-11]|nr:MAG: hypothetical protein B7Z33_07650 [Sphingomonadales bacterium 12-68-11]